MQSVFSYSKKLSILGLFCMLLILSACVKTYDLLNTEFPQDHYPLINKASTIKDVLRSATVYDEFETVATFDVLWFSNAVASKYAELYGKKRGENEQKITARARQLHEENTRKLTFYVLADVREETHDELSDPKPVWSMCLQRRDRQPLVPETINIIYELEPEIAYLFGPLVNDFKMIYEVTFSIDSLTTWKTDEPILFVFRSVERAVTFVFNAPVGTKEVNVTGALGYTKEPGAQDDDFYWG